MHVQDESTEAEVVVHAKPVGDVCAGCQELLSRIERLELLITERQEFPLDPAFSTQASYAVCLGFHVLLLVATSSSSLYLIGVSLAGGGLASIMMCQVFTNRSLVVRTLRSLFSLMVCGGAMLGCFALVFGGRDLLDTLPGVIVSVSLAMFACWLPMKTVALITGWRILVPGSTQATPKLQIRDLMFLTLIAALWMTVLRLCWPGVREIVQTEQIPYFGMMVAVSLAVAVFATFASRTLLGSNRSYLIQLAALVFLGTTVMTSLLWALLVYLGEGDSWEIAFYALPSGLATLVSPLLTLSLLRAAGYRLSTTSKKSRHKTDNAAAP